jgi:hypothetical protein
MKTITIFVLLFFSLPYSVYSQEPMRKKVVDTLTYETQSGLPIAASKIYFSDSKFTISGYGESNYINYRGEKNTQSEDLELYMTNMQRFVVYAAYKPKKWLVLYAEIFAEYMNDGTNERHFEFQPEVFADFLFSEKFNLRLGTHQAQIGYINNSDEPVMFYTVNRPEVERIIIPSTWIDLGVMTYGKINKDFKWSASLYQGLDPTDLGQVLGRNVYGFYTEVGYNIWPYLKGNRKSANDIKNLLVRSSEIKLPIFIRYERLNTHNRIDESLMNEPIFKSDLTAITIGANFNPRRNIVIKTNYQFRNNIAPLADGSIEGNRFEIGLGFIF